MLRPSVAGRSGKYLAYSASRMPLGNVAVQNSAYLDEQLRPVVDVSYCDAFYARTGGHGKDAH